MSSLRHDFTDRIQTRSGALASMICALALALLLGYAMAWFQDPMRQRVAGEEYLGDLSFDLQFLDYVVLDAKAQLLEDARDVGILGIGDSSCQFGLAPAAMQESSGLPVLNLGTFGTVGVEGHVAVLDAALRSAGRPRCVVLWLHPHTLVLSDHEVEATGQLDWFRDRIETESGSPQGLLPRLNDTVGGAMRLAVLDHGGWRKVQLGETLTPVEVRRRMLADNGWFAALPQSAPKMYTQQDLDADALGHLGEIAKRCAAEQISLFLAVMPRVLEGPVDATRYESLVQSIRNSVPGAIWLESMPREVSWEVMQSPTHFAREQAELVSGKIGEEIRATLYGQ